MSRPYSIAKVNIHDMSQIEPMGTKKKFWLDSAKGDESWLFKYNRPNTGEDWAEKIASEIAELIGLPHAITHLAQCNEQRGVLSEDFTRQATRGHLVHGNELLTAIDPNYPTKQFWQVTQHSIENIIGVLSRSFIHLPKEGLRFLV